VLVNYTQLSRTYLAGNCGHLRVMLQLCKREERKWNTLPLITRAENPILNELRLRINFSGDSLACGNIKIISPTPTSCATGETGHQCQPTTLIIKKVHDVICTQTVPKVTMLECLTEDLHRYAGTTADPGGRAA
jgi:hypothetical protein